MRRPLGAVAALAVTLVAVPLWAGPADGVADPGAVTKSTELSRVHLVAGADSVVERRTFRVTVAETRNLRDRQAVEVTWSGAHPTGGIVGDHNSGQAAEQEYPVVLMQCRGTAATLTPQTCWTQTPNERFQSDYTFPYPAYRIDRYAAAADRQWKVGLPSPLPAACDGARSGTQHWVPFRAADGTVYGGGSLGCAGMPPESANADGALQPGNTTYAVTGLDGTGGTRFVISTADTNASLGCSATVPCSLVVVPIAGISCDATAAALPVADRPSPQSLADTAFQRCSGTGHYAPGQISPGGVGQEDLAVAGALWWSASNWRHRIAVPLTFAQPANVCDLVNSSAPTYVYGSPLMAQATLQWAPAFCLDPKSFKVQHVLTGEPQARNLLESRGIDAAFVAGPPERPYTRPVVHAPAALTGFAIGYAIDDAHHHEWHHLRLTPRLLAKLLTLSYPSNPTVRSEYPALHANPLDLPSDPEFQALNPGPPGPGYQNEPASVLFAMSSDSDVMTALTSYVDADPEARAWLDGKPDPWGTVVNPAYQGIALPVHSWPQLDTFEPKGLYQSDRNPCLATSPVPWLPLVAAPVSSLATITANLQFGIAASQIVCANAGQQNQKLAAVGRELPGQRFLVAVTSLADAARYQIDRAALRTSGTTFVGPDDASLRAAGALLRRDAAANTWRVPYDVLRSPAGRTAYPGAMLASVDVPVSGLPRATAARYAALLRFVAGRGQVRGLGNGDLPPGYLPVTAANGLGALSAYTLAAASAVAAQAGIVPPVVPVAAPAPAPRPPAAPPVEAAEAVAPPVTAPLAPAAVKPTPVVAAAPAPRVAPARPAGATALLGPGALGVALPALALLGLVAGALALTRKPRRH